MIGVGLGAVIAAVVAAIGTMVSNNQQETANEHLAKFQADANQKYLDAQNQYNSPKSQMQRFQAAGLNPHLMYGQGNPGNQSTSLTYPDIKPIDRGKPVEQLANMLPLINQTRLAESQVGAQNASTQQKYADVKLKELQSMVLKKNPLLDDEGFKATIEGLKAAAELKRNQAGLAEFQNSWNRKTIEISGEGTDYYRGTQGDLKLQKEMDLLTQRFNLNSADLNIKGQVAKSKEFQNAIAEVQKKFLVDGDIGPAQFYQFVLLLLTKML